MLILGIETSCDETAAAVLDDSDLRSNVVYSQLEIHQKFGGVVPELASRAHLTTIIPTIQQALEQAKVSKSDLDGIAVTYGPGLIGALLVGINVAKAMAYAAGIPLIGVNHLEGHIFATRLDHPEISPPFVTLLVSGGHTILVQVNDWGDYRILGATVDDAVGEAFDKVAKMLSLGYPGGPLIDRHARDGNPEFVYFPRAMMKEDSYSFSFSGLKTAVLQYLASKKETEVRDHFEDICASFQNAVAEVLIEKTVRACKEFDISIVTLGGGVARNEFLRRKFRERAEKEKLEVYFPSPDYCTDNAAMIAEAGRFYLQQGKTSPLSLDAIPNLVLATERI